MTCRSNERRGAALLWAITILAVLGVTSGVAVHEFGAARRTLKMRHDRIQAEWLTRSGIELATARLLDDADYKGETVEPIKNGPVAIKVTKDGKSFLIHCEAKYPADEVRAVTFTTNRKATRKSEGGKVTIVLNAVSNGPPEL
jgi:hypothetical protein